MASADMPWNVIDGDGRCRPERVSVTGWLHAKCDYSGGDAAPRLEAKPGAEGWAPGRAVWSARPTAGRTARSPGDGRAAAGRPREQGVSEAWPSGDRGEDEDPRAGGNGLFTAADRTVGTV